MTKKRIHPSGYIKSVLGRKFDDCEVAALIEDLELVPEFLITPSLVKTYRNELRNKKELENCNRENVIMAINYTIEFLNSEYGKWRIEEWHKKFDAVLPFNR